MDPYYTIIVPYVSPKHATKWHPTESWGPFSKLCRGNFPDEDKAIEWAQTHLNGTPYTIKLIKE